MNRYELMESFLTVIKEFVHNNPQLIGTKLKEFIYAQLVTFNLKDGQEPMEDISDCFADWIKYFENKELTVFKSINSPKFCQFKNINNHDTKYKVYIPIDSYHIDNCVKEIFDFMIDNGIRTASFVAANVRNDNVIIRVSTMSDLVRIVDYANNSMSIEKGLLNANPFLINVGNIGVSYEKYYSYNLELSKVIANLIKRLYSQDRMDLLNVNMLHEYLGILAKKSKNNVLKSIYELQFLATTRKKISIDEFYSITEAKPVSNSIKEFYLRGAILETYKKYHSVSQVVSAINKYKQGIYNSFTNNESARINLIDAVKPDEIDDIIQRSIKKSSKSNTSIKQYVEKVISGEMLDDEVFDVQDKYKILSDAFLVTAKRYNKQQALAALQKYIKTGSADSFTRNNNARLNIEKNIKSNQVLEIIRTTLGMLKGTADESILEEFAKQFKV